MFSVWSTTPAGTCRCPKGTSCDNAGKHPIAARGFHDATTDTERITRLLSAASEPNYGLVCPPGVFALDVDGPDIARLEALEERLGSLPPTLRTRTANGSHIFLRWPDGIAQPQGKLFGFVTRFGDTGYVIGPRSVHATGASYSPEGPAEVAEMPPHWVAAARQNGHEPGPRIHIGDELPDTGGRHDWLRDRARYYRGVGMTRDVLRAALLAENARLPSPKTVEEVERAIGRVFELFPADEPAVTEERVSRRLGDDELGLLGPSTATEFPPSPDPVAFEGLLGDCLADIAPGTDASLAGIMGSLIAFCAAMIPGQAYFHRVQTSSPFIALVGESSIGRKGTAMYRAHDALAEVVEQMYMNRAILDGLNSGEGLVAALHHKQENFKYEPTVGLVFEEEYASLLASRGREGSTLDPKMRQAFDGGVISNRRAGTSLSVVPPYWLPALIAITPIELRHRLEAGALQSGSANRWLYLPVVKRDIVPINDRPLFSPHNRQAILSARRWAVDQVRTLDVDPQVTETLTRYSDWLPLVSHGVAHDLTRRFSIIAFRIALVHAMVEQSEIVTFEHLRRALALTEYARKGVPWVFGSTVGNEYADLLLRHLQDTGRLRRSQISRDIIRDPIRRQGAIDELVRLGLARVVTVHPEGRGGPTSWLEPATHSIHFHHFGHSQTDPARSGGDDGDVSPFVLKTPGDVSEMYRQSMAMNGGESSPNEWLSPCRDYSRHQASHRWTADGWVCELCREGA